LHSFKVHVHIWYLHCLKCGDSAGAGGNGGSSRPVN
jgi:hypothetical protein